MAAKNKVEIISIRFKNDDHWALGDDTSANGNPVTNIRLERDGYNKQKQVLGPVYVIETENGFRSIHPVGELESLAVQVTEIDNKNTRELPDNASAENRETRALPEDDAPPVENNEDDLDMVDFPEFEDTADNEDVRQPVQF